jgi:hypothetical protein
MPNPLITVIGRGHSGTRAISHTLSQSGVYMGAKLNGSGDLIPPDDMYQACRVMGRHVVHCGGLEWDFSKLHTMDIEPEFERLVRSYLVSVLDSDAERRGWKLPETTLVYPWIVRMFPDIKYIHWVRDPRDSILSKHLTDDLADFDVPYDHTDNIRLRRAISWLYQAKLVQSTPEPTHFITVRLEDFVLDQQGTLDRLEDFLGIKLARIEVKPEVVGRWKTDDGEHDFEFLHEQMQRYGYR